MVDFFELPLASVFGHLKAQDLFTSIWTLNKKANQILKDNPITFLNSYATQWSLNPEHLNPSKDWREEAKFRLQLELMNMLPHTFIGFVSKVDQLRLSTPPLQQHKLAFLVNSARKHLKWTTHSALQLGKYFASQHRVMGFEIDPLLRQLNIYPVSYNCISVPMKPCSPSTIKTLYALIFVFDKHGNKRQVTYQHTCHEFSLFYDNTCICRSSRIENKYSIETYFNQAACRQFKQEILLDFGLDSSDITFLSVFLLTFMSTCQQDLLYYALENAFNTLSQVVDNREEKPKDITEDKQQSEDSKSPQIHYEHSWAHLLSLKTNQTMFKLWDKMDEPTITMRGKQEERYFHNNEESEDALLQDFASRISASTLHSYRPPYLHGNFSFPSYINSFASLQESKDFIEHATKLFRSQLVIRHSAEMWLQNLLQYSREANKKANAPGISLMTKLVEDATFEVSNFTKTNHSTGHYNVISANLLFCIKSPFTGKLCTFNFLQEHPLESSYDHHASTTLQYGDYNLYSDSQQINECDGVLSFSNLLEQRKVIAESNSSDSEKAWILAKLRQDLFGDTQAIISEWLLLSFIFTLARGTVQWRNPGFSAIMSPIDNNMDLVVTRSHRLIELAIKSLSYPWELSYITDLNDTAWKLAKEQKEQAKEAEQNKYLAEKTARKEQKLRDQRNYAEHFASALLTSEKYKYCATLSFDNVVNSPPVVVPNCSGSFLSNECLFYTDMSVWPPTLVRNTLPSGLSNIHFSSTGDLLCGRENNRTTHGISYKYHVYKTFPPTVEERYRIGDTSKMEICGFIDNVLVCIDYWGQVLMQGPDLKDLHEIKDIPKCERTSFNVPARGVIMQLPPPPSPTPFSLDMLVINGSVYAFNPTTFSFSEMTVVDEQNQHTHVGEKVPIGERDDDSYDATEFFQNTLAPLSYKNPATNSLQCFYVYAYQLFELVWKDSSTLLKQHHELPDKVVNAFVAGELGIIYGIPYKLEHWNNHHYYYNYTRSFVVYNPNTRIRKLMRSAAFGAGLGKVELIWSDATRMLVAVSTTNCSTSDSEQETQASDESEPECGRMYCILCKVEIDDNQFYKKGRLRMHENCYEGLGAAEKTRLNFTKSNNTPKLIKLRHWRGRTQFYALPASVILQYQGDSQLYQPPQKPPQ